MKSLVLCLLLFSSKGLTQQTCQGGYTEYILNANHIRASFFPRGNKFNTGNTGGFIVPFSGGSGPSTIFASSPWIGGFDDAGNFKGAFETYGDAGGQDFGIGPLESIGIPFPDSVCSRFDTAWTVTSDEIYHTLNDYYEDFIVDDTISSIFGWPAKGNKYFKRFNGFDLPDSTRYWAPFRDMNGNGKYDPDKGEHPDLNPASTSDVPPDQLLWMVFNDVIHLSATNDTRPIRVEIQLAAFAYNCEDNEVLNNTIFNRYTLINRAVVPVDSLFFGMWSDYNLGCAEDDFVGSDSSRNSEFVYNADPIDGDSNNQCIDNTAPYQLSSPPAQSMTWLSHPMYAFIQVPLPDTFSPLSRYRMLNGQWPDGTVIRPSGDGYHQNPGLPSTRYLFNGDPRETTSWAANHVMDTGSDVQTLSSISLGRINPGGRVSVEMAYTFHYDARRDYLGQLTAMYNNIDSLLSIDYTGNEPCTRLKPCYGDDCVWPGDFDHNGIVNHDDLLPWASQNGLTGPARVQNTTWRGQWANDWNQAYNLVNNKHVDGNGDGRIDLADIEVIYLNHLKRNSDYQDKDEYPDGNGLILNAQSAFTDGITEFTIQTGRRLENVLGISFEVEYDTSLFRREGFHVYWPDSTNGLVYPLTNDSLTYFPFACIQKNHEGVNLSTNYKLLEGSPYSLRLKEGKVAPDSTIIKLKNLKGIDEGGRPIPLGSKPLVVYKKGYIPDPVDLPTAIVYPNPTVGTFYIHVPQPTGGELYSIQGVRMAYFENMTPGAVTEISGLIPGIYVLRFRANGETVKLVVQ